MFQIYCAYHSGLQLVKYKQDVTVAPDAVISAMEGRVGNVYYVFEAQNRWLQADKVEAIPRPGYLVIYGVRGSTPYTHVGIVESVTALDDGMYELTTIEGNVNSTIKRMNYRYDATPRQSARSAVGFIGPMTESLFGLAPDAAGRTIAFAPHTPIGWDGWRLENVKIGGAHVTLTSERISPSQAKYTLAVSEPGWTVVVHEHGEEKRIAVDGAVSLVMDD